jgi:hypothetical protein
MKPLTYRREIERLIAENAALLGEVPELEIRRPGKDWVRIQLVLDGRPVRGRFTEYLGWPRALAAAREANRNAHQVAQQIAGGMPKDEAIRRVAEKYR